MKRIEFRTLDNAKAHILKLEAATAKATNAPKPAPDAKAILTKAQPTEVKPARAVALNLPEVTEQSLKATILVETDWRNKWAMQRTLNALQTARVNSAVYPKARK
jgi:hypothetical protein